MTKNDLIKKAAILGLIASSALLLGACKLYKSPQGTSDQNQTTQQSQTQSSPSAQNTAGTVITYSDNGFSPNQITVKVGDKIAFTNNASKAVQVNSAPHPTHELYPELNLGSIAAGQTMTTSFTKAGTYKYHNHANASQNGTIVVQ